MGVENTPFTFSVEEGLRLSPETFGVLAKARRIGTHGDVLSVHASKTGFRTIYRNGKVRNSSSDVKLYNDVLSDIASEPERRKAWKAAHPAPVKVHVVHAMPRPPAQKGLDERMAGHSAVPPLDLDAAHHRVRF